MDSVAFSFVLLCLFSGGMAQEDHHDHRVDVKVYYESMCADSIKFVTTQLHPALEKKDLAKLVNLTLIPFGKSSYDTSSTMFTCHHGPRECEGNKIHSCSLQLIQNGRNTDQLGYNSGAFDFVNCLLKKVQLKGDETTFPVKDCTVDQTGVPEANINNCAKSADGTKYLIANGNLTDEFQKPLKSAPTVVFNKKFSEDDNKLAQTNFVQALCKYIEHDKPAECSGASAPAALMGTIILSLFFLSKVF